VLSGAVLAEAAERGQPEEEAGGGTSVSNLTFRERMYTKNYKTNGLVVETDKRARKKNRMPAISEYQLVGDIATKEGLDSFNSLIYTEQTEYQVGAR